MKIFLQICRFLILTAAILVLLHINSKGAVRDNSLSQTRISFLSGTSFIQRASGLSYEEVSENMPVTEGDRIGTADGRMEINFGNGNYIRLDRNTKIDFTRLPRSTSSFTQIQLWSGSIIISLGTLETEKHLEIRTPDMSAYLLDKGEYRLDVEDGKKTRIQVFRGMLEAAGESESILIKKSQRATAFQGRITQSEELNAASQDNFFYWNKGREEIVRKNSSRGKPAAPAAVRPAAHRESLLKAKDYNGKPLPSRINQQKLKTGIPESPVNRLYQYISRGKTHSARSKNIKKLGPGEQTVKPPKKIRPPTKKDSKKKK